MCRSGAVRHALLLLLTLGITLFAGCLLSTATAAGSRPTSKACPATLVEGDAVRAGLFRGLIAKDYDVVDGRFSLRVGGMRTETMSSKIPWFVSSSYRVEHQLRIAGRGYYATARRFTQMQQRAGGGPGRGGVFPSIIDPPTAGCWRLTFRSGDAFGQVTVFVRPAVATP